MPQKPSWRHHYLPEFYLKRWADKGGKGQLVEFSKPWGPLVKSKRVYPRATGFVDRLNELRGLPEADADIIEREFFSPVDNKAAVVLAKMEAGVIRFTNTERSAWAKFVLSLVFRVPETIAKTTKHMAADVAASTDVDRIPWVLSSDRKSDVFEALDRLSDDNTVSRVALVAIVETINSVEIGTALINMQWGVLRAPLFAPALLTSDRPVYWANGLGDPQCHILMPIGPKLIFYAVHHGSFHPFLADAMAAGRVVSVLNDNLTRRAVRFVYGLGEGSRSYVQERMGRNPVKLVPDDLLEFRNPAHRRKMIKEGKLRLSNPAGRTFR